MATIPGDRLCPRVRRGSGRSKRRAPPKKWSLGPRRRQGSEASRAPQAAEARGHDARRLRLDLGSERKKGLRLGVSSSKLCSQLANARSAQESRGLGAPGARGRAQPAWKGVAARGQLRRAQTPRRPSFVAAALARSLARPLRTRRPPARLSAALSTAAAAAAARAAAAAAAAPSRRVTPPLKPEPFPGRRRPLCQSAPRAPTAPAPRGSRRLRAAPRPRPGRRGARPAPGRREAAASSVNKAGSRAPAPAPFLRELA